MNLSSLGSFGSLATSAFDTARSTFKGLAEAAVAPAGADSPAVGAQPAPVHPAKPVAARDETTESAADPAPAKATGRRFGTLVDAYA